MPDKLRHFKRNVHDAIIFDDLRDLRWVSDHQDKLQCKYNAVLEFGSTPGGQCAYYKYLFRIPFIMTCNLSTHNLGLLETDDWLGKPQNRVVLPFEGVGANGAEPAALSCLADQCLPCVTQSSLYGTREPHEARCRTIHEEQL